MTCPLCGSTESEPVLRHARGRFHRCDVCALLFLDPARWPRYEDEIARYGHHHNDAGDDGYLRHLGLLVEPLLEAVPLGARGLDFGSGPGDALAQLLTAHGRPTVAYDPAFRPTPDLLAGTYDFVVCCEVLEHVHRPRELLETFQRLVRPGGAIGVMTAFYDAAPSLADWWYLRDETHVCIYGVDTMRWIADEFGWEVGVTMPNVAIIGL